jgi:hypothetical protein
MNKLCELIINGDLFIEDIDIFCVDESHNVVAESPLNILLTDYYYNSIFNNCSKQLPLILSFFSFSTMYLSQHDASKKLAMQANIFNSHLLTLTHEETKIIESEHIKFNLH